MFIQKNYPKIYLVFALLALCIVGRAQVQPSDSFKIDYIHPAEYEIGAVRFEGLNLYDPTILLMLTGLYPGELIEIPSEKFSLSIKRLWEQGYLNDLHVAVDSTAGKKIYLKIKGVEVLRVSRFIISGLKKTDRGKLEEKLKPFIGKPCDGQFSFDVLQLITDYFTEKGYYQPQIKQRLQPDPTLAGKFIYYFDISPGRKVKIDKIIWIGNSELSDRRLRKAMKNCRQKNWSNLFKPSKFDKEGYEKDKKALIALYHSQGLRDAEIVKDSIYLTSANGLTLELTIAEGKKYYLRNISWVGNTKYSTDTLNSILGVKKGDIYSQAAIEKAIYMSPGGNNVSSLYLDQGYLFFSITPVETGFSGDSIDIELRVHEGAKAIINKIIITGNTKTNNHVILREIYTKPGQLFNRTDLMLSQQALIRLGYFEPDKIQAKPIPDITTGLVDIEYIVVEKPSDQITLSGGIGAGKLVGTLGLTLTNVALKDVFNKKAWKPYPVGNGQIVSLSAQANGRSFQTYNLSVTEPWLGGKKPNSFTGGLMYNHQQSGDTNRFSAWGFSIGLGSRWKKPDAYFNSFYSLNLFKYYSKNWPGIPFNGDAYNVNVGITIGRNSVDANDYPMWGSNLSVGVQATPPWSLISGKTNSRLIEYHKWKADLSWFFNPGGKFVLNAAAHVGYLGRYNVNMAASAFERFNVGGVQLAGANLVGVEFINLRGYANGSLSPTSGSAFYNKFALELRHPILMNKESRLTVYGLVFAEAGNAWNPGTFNDVFALKRSVGAGIRLNLPILGLIGFDYGYGFDNAAIPGYTGRKGQWHFIIGKYLN